MDDGRLFRLRLGNEQHLRAHLEDIKGRASRQPNHGQLASVFRASAMDLMTLFRSHYHGRTVDIGIRWLISEILENVAVSFLGELVVYKFKYEIQTPWGPYEVADLGHLINLFEDLDMDVDGYFSILCSNGRFYPKKLLAAAYQFVPHSPPGPPRFVEIRYEYFTVRLPAEMMWDEAVKLKQNIQPLLRVAVQLIPSPLSLRFKPYLTDKYVTEHIRQIIGLRRYADALGRLERWIAVCLPNGRSPDLFHFILDEIAASNARLQREYHEGEARRAAVELVEVVTSTPRQRRYEMFLGGGGS